MREVIILLLIIILSVICIIMNYKQHNNIHENYDIEIPDLTVDECGTRCTQGVNCTAFAYKPTEAKCYLSKTAILGEPTESIYSDVYSKLDRRCNKIFRITDDRPIDSNTMTRNSIYICSDGEKNTATQYQYANNGGTALETARTTIFDRADMDIATPVNVNYKVYEIDYPKVKPDNTKLKPFLGQNKDNTIKIDTEEYGFIESDKEFLGQYMLAHQCVVNVPLFDCLKYCENSKTCAGTEWNKSLIIRSDIDNKDYLYENVCCPKSVIKQIIPRRNKMNRGKFYIKKKLQDIANTDKIILSKMNDSTLFSSKEKRLAFSSPREEKGTNHSDNNKFYLNMTHYDKQGDRILSSMPNTQYIEWTEDNMKLVEPDYNQVK